MTSKVLKPAEALPISFFYKITLSAVLFGFTAQAKRIKTILGSN
tara:strand:+ start:43 stop:174 length:132 start_codon:yes stop_codon:yes gene_type:complete